MTCFAAKSTTHEPVETLLLIKGQLCFLAANKLVKTTLIGNQCSFVRLHCQTKEEREVGFHLSMARDISACIVPELRLKCLPNQFCVGLIQTHTVRCNQRRQYAVTGMYLLHSQRTYAAIQHFLAELREASSPIRTMGHFHTAPHRAYGLRSQRRIIDQEVRILADNAVVVLPHTRVRVLSSEDVFTVEEAVSTSVPELTSIECSIDD